MYKNIFLPASMLAGAIIGAGIFSLPFVFQKSGLLAGFVSLFLFAFIYAFVYFIYADIVLRTEGKHRFVGYSKIYLGKPGFFIAIIIWLVQLLLVLTVYLILAPSFTQMFVGGNYLAHLLVFWLLGSFIILLSVKRLAWLEFFIVSGIVLIIFLVFIFGVGKLSIASFSPNFNLDILAVVGPILFALFGVLAVPEVVAYFRESRTPLKFLKRSLLLGVFLPALAYAVFVFGVAGLSKNISEDAVSGLVGQAPIWLVISLGILGLLSLLSSYILVGLSTRHILEYDFYLPPVLTKFLIILIPPVFYFLGIKEFIETVSFIGSVLIPLEIILLIIIWWKADLLKPTNDFFSRKFIKISLPFLLIIFLTALFYSLR